MTVNVHVDPAGFSADGEFAGGLYDALQDQQPANGRIAAEEFDCELDSGIAWKKSPNLNLCEGGINNFIQAGNKLAGQARDAGMWGIRFSNAWVHNTVESMSVALLVDPQGDAEIIKAQTAMRAKLEEWIPIILAAQEPDGYMQTRFTLGTARENGRSIWDPRTRDMRQT